MPISIRNKSNSIIIIGIGTGVLRVFIPTFCMRTLVFTIRATSPGENELND